MREGQPLHFYAKPVKPFLLLLASAIFVAIGYLMLHDPKASANPGNVFMAWVDIIFFGLGVVVFLIMIVRDIILRRAIIEIG